MKFLHLPRLRAKQRSGAWDPYAGNCAAIDYLPDFALFVLFPGYCTPCALETRPQPTTDSFDGDLGHLLNILAHRQLSTPGSAFPCLIPFLAYEHFRSRVAAGLTLLVYHLAKSSSSRILTLRTCSSLTGSLLSNGKTTGTRTCRVNASAPRCLTARHRPSFAGTLLPIKLRLDWNPTFNSKNPAHPSYSHIIQSFFRGFGSGYAGYALIDFLKSKKIGLSNRLVRIGISTYLKARSCFANKTFITAAIPVWRSEDRASFRTMLFCPVN